MLKHITNKEFNEEVLKSESKVLVDFYADWCGPCRMLAPVMDKIGEEYNVYKINIDDEEELAKQYGIMSIPCVIAFKDGVEINRSVGFVDKDTILNLIK